MINNDYIHYKITNIFVLPYRIFSGLFCNGCITFSMIFIYSFLSKTLCIGAIENGQQGYIPASLGKRSCFKACGFLLMLQYHCMGNRSHEIAKILVDLNRSFHSIAYERIYKLFDVRSLQNKSKVNLC